MRNHGLTLLLLATMLAACSLVPGQPSPSPSPTSSPPPSPSPTPQRSPSPSTGSGFYLRGWYTQALPPSATFSWLPMLTIAEGTLIDGNVAIDMIYPGPLVIVPVARSISDEGVATIISEARRLGLLGAITDFTGNGVMPGSKVAQLELIVDGIKYSLVGSPDLARPCGSALCDAEPATPEAFSVFWAELSSLDAWIPSGLGASVQYQPERIAVLLTAPNGPEPGLSQPPVAWPLDKPFEELGVEFPGQAGDRCATLSGDDLTAVWPALVGATQLTTFVDSFAVIRSVVVAVLVPGQESPCPDSAV